MHVTTSLELSNSTFKLNSYISVCKYNQSYAIVKIAHKFLEVLCDVYTRI